MSSSNKNPSLTLHVGVVLLTVLLSLVFFWRVFIGEFPGPFNWLYYWLPWHRADLTGGGNYVISDQMDQFLPFLNYVKTSLWSGEIPLWNEKLIFGTPFFQMFIIGHLYPPVFLTLMTTPTEYFWFAAAVVKFVLLSFFLFKLLQRYGIELGVALLSSILFAFGLFSIVWAGDYLSYSFSAIPLFYYALTRYPQDGPTRLNCLLVLAASINFALSAFPSVTFYAGVVAVPYVLVAFSGRIFNERFLKLLILGLFAGCICSIPLFYTGEYLSTIDLSYRVRFANTHIPHRNLIQLFMPNIFGEFAQMQIKGFGNYNEYMGYIGLVALLTGVSNLFFLFSNRDYAKNRYVWFWTIIQWWSLAMAFNLFNILDVFGALPGFGTNSSTRLMSMWVFASAIVSAYSLNHLIYSERQAKRLKAFAVLLSVAAIVGFSVALFPEVQHILNPSHVKHQIILTGVITALLVSLIFFKSVKQHGVVLIVLGIISFGNFYYLASSFNSYYRPADFYPVTDSIAFMQENLDTDSKIIALGKHFIPQTPLYYGIASAQSRWFLDVGHIEYLKNLDPKFREVHKTAHSYKMVDMTQPNPVLNFLNVKYLLVDRIHYAKYPRDEALFPVAGHFEDRLTLFENVSRPYTADAPGEVCSDEKLYEYENRSDRVRFIANSCSEREVKLPIWSYPGWRSNVPGIQLKSSKEGFLSLRVPEGKQEIMLEFYPTGFNYLILLTLLSGIGFITMMATGTFQKGADLEYRD